MIIKHIRTYGRVRCRSLNNEIMINNKYLNKNFNNIDFLKNKQLTLEIGFGNGEVLLHRSNLYKDYVHIGVDVYENGICKVLKTIKNNNLEHIHIFNMDARDFITEAINNNIIFNEIYILFPDPWHRKSDKKKEKKRLINITLLQNILKILQINGNVYFATDHLDYYNNVKNILIDLKLKIDEETINTYINNNFILSNYEKKAINNRYYILCTKIH